MLRGKSGCVLVVAKYREKPIHWWTVTRSAHMTEVMMECHLDWSPSQALNNA